MFDKNFETMQTQIDKNMEPPAKKYKPDEHDIKGKGNRDQFDFDIEISFAIQECELQISRSNIEDLSTNLTSVATKLRKRNKLIKLANRLPEGWSIVQEYKQDPIARDSLNAQKIRQAEQRAIRKRKVKTPANFTHSSSSTISKAPSFWLRNASFENGYRPPIATKTKFEYNANNPFNNTFYNPFRYTRTCKSTDIGMGCGEQCHLTKD